MTVYMIRAGEMSQHRQQPDDQPDDRGNQHHHAGASHSTSLFLSACNVAVKSLLVLPNREGVI
jgi:hypothetical protein